MARFQGAPGTRGEVLALLAWVVVVVARPPPDNMVPGDCPIWMHGPETCFAGGEYEWPEGFEGVFGPAPSLPGRCVECGYGASFNVDGAINCISCEDGYEIVSIFDDCTGVCADKDMREYLEEEGFIFEWNQGNCQPWTVCQCADDADWHKRGDPEKNCAWVALAGYNRCTVKDENGAYAFERCRIACGSCGTPCVDDPDFHKDGDETKDCVWVSRLINRCAVLAAPEPRGDGTFWGAPDVAWDNCRAACRTCEVSASCDPPGRRNVEDGDDFSYDPSKVVFVDWNFGVDSAGDLTVPAGTAVTFSWDDDGVPHALDELPDREALDACDFSNARARSDDSAPWVTEWVARGRPGETRYFACPVGPHCAAGGMKVAVTWEATAEPWVVADSTSWHKKGDADKTCEWVAAFPDVRCLTKGETNEVFAFEACQLSCGVEGKACRDDPYWHKEGDPSKDCFWVSRLKNRCTVTGEYGEPAYTECARACGACDVCA